MGRICGQLGSHRETSCSIRYNLGSHCHIGITMISRLGRFEMKAEIGRGGFGQVFRAYDPVMNRDVAVKVLTATEDAASFNRFKNEATAAGNLHHENIVTVYEFGQEGRTPFLVME